MKVLVTGATGSVGSVLVHELLKRGADVRTLTRKKPDPGRFPKGVETRIGDLLDPESVQQAMLGVDKLFLLNAVSPDELMQALIGFGLAKRLGLKHITYLSVFKVEQVRNGPHNAAKLAMETVLREYGVPFTILRPGYFMQNEAMMKSQIMEMGMYPWPIGTAGICAVDIRDIAEAAAISLTSEGHEGKTYDLVGPSLINGPSNAALWSSMLGREVQYAGHDFDAWEKQMQANVPSWMAFDLRTMFEGFYEKGYQSTETEVTLLTELLGHAPRSYADYALELATEWKR